MESETHPEKRTGKGKAYDLATRKDVITAITNLLHAHVETSPHFTADEIRALVRTTVREELAAMLQEHERRPLIHPV